MPGEEKKAYHKSFGGEYLPPHPPVDETLYNMEMKRGEQNYAHEYFLALIIEMDQLLIANDISHYK